MNILWLTRIFSKHRGPGCKQRRKRLHQAFRPSRHQYRRTIVEGLEDRRLLASLSDGGGSTLNIALASDESFSIVSNGSTYGFNTNRTFNNSGIAAAGDFSAFGEILLTLQSSGLTRYDTISIVDSGSNARVTFNNSGANAYSDNISIVLDDAFNSSLASLVSFNAITFNGSTAFTGSNALNAVASTKIVANSGSSIITVDGAITLEANMQTSATQGGVFHGIDINGTTIGSTTGSVTLRGRGGNVSSNNYGILVRGNSIVGQGTTGSVLLVGTGQGGIVNVGPGNVGVNINAATSGGIPVITSGGGNVSVTGNSDAPGSSGVFVAGGQITAGGGGTVTVIGRGGTSGGGNQGVALTNGFTTVPQITSSGGNVSVTGYGGGNPNVNGGGIGVYVDNAGKITAGGMGSVTVVGTGGDAALGDGNSGVKLYYIGAQITSNGGNVSVTGTGGETAGNFQIGVELAYGGQITAGGNGTVTVMGTGGNTLGTIRGDACIGVDVDGANGGKITSSGGNVSVTGFGGGNSSSYGNHGVRAWNIIANVAATSISAGGSGTVTVVGQANNQALEGAGVVVYSTTQITSSGGDIAVTGTGGSGGGSNNFGVVVYNQGSIAATQAGKVTVVGTGGSTIGSFNDGVSVGYFNPYTSDEGYVRSSGGDVFITGTPGGGANGYGISLDPGGVSTVNSGNITLTADTISWGGSLSAGPRSLTIQPKTPGTEIDIGFNEVAGHLLVYNFSFPSISAGTVNIGNALAGAITLQNSATSSAPTVLNLITAPSKGVSPIATGTDLNLGVGGSLAISSNSDLNIAINGTTVDTQYNQLRVTGSANLADVDLVLSGNFTPTANNVFMIVSATSRTGTFNGLPENAIVPFRGRSLRINYTATSVTLTDVGPFLTPVNLSVSASSGTEAGTTAITVTATASSTVSGNQTVALGVSGTGITTGDYALSNSTITILSGQTTGSVTFTVKDDLLIEGNETATLTISNPSAGISLGTTISQNIAITDDDNATTSTYGLPVAGAYRLVLSGGTLEIYNSGNSLVASRPLGTAAVVINGTAGNDTLTVDFSGGNFTVPISFNGGAQTSAPGDSLTLTGGTFASGTFGFTNNSDGTVLLAGNSLISYSGLEPIVTTGTTINDVIFTFNGGAETITLTDATGAAMTIESTLGESVTFANPSGSLTINAGTLDDTITLTSVDAAYRGAISVNGDGGTDAVNWNAAATLGSATATGNVNVGAETITLNNTLAADVGRTIAVSLLAANGVTLSGASADVTTGGGTFTVNADSDANGSGIYTQDNAGSAVSTGGGNVSITAIDTVLTGTINAGAGSVTFLPSVAGTNIIFGASGRGSFATAYGGLTDNNSNAIATDTAGNVYTTGFFTGSGDFDPGPGTTTFSNPNGRDVFVSKFDKNGNFVWAAQFGGTGPFNEGTGIAADNIGNVYVTGYFTATVDFNPDATATYSLTADGSSSAFVVKLNASGNFDWAAKLPGETGGIVLDSAGNVYTVGGFQGTGDFDPSSGTFNLTSSGSNFNSYVSKLDNNGNFVWAKRFGGVSGDSATRVAIDSTGNLYATGIFYGTADFDPGPNTFNLTSTGDADVFVMKLNSSGDLIWAKGLGGAALDDTTFGGITVDSLGNVYTTGYFYGSADFDPGTLTHILNGTPANNIFVSKLNDNGEFVWAKSISNNDTSTYARGVAVDGSGNVYLGGFFRFTMDFDPGPATNNMTPGPAPSFNNAFVLKLTANGNFVSTRQFTGSNSQNRAIALGSSGNVLTAGNFSNIVDFDPGTSVYNLSATGPGTNFVASLDPDLNFLPGPTGFALNDAELDNVTTTGKIVVGNATAGNVTFSAAISMANASVLEVITGGDITDTVSGNALTGDTLILKGDLAPALTGRGTFDVDGPATFDGTASYEVNLNGTANYDQLVVAGASRTITLGGAELAITLDTIPAFSSGNVFRIVDSTGAGSTVSGTFKYGGTTLNDGDVFTVGSTNFRINYNPAGATGDVTLTEAGAVQVILVPVNLSVSASIGTEAGTTAITVTATAATTVDGAQSVALGVSGTGITTGDYALSNSTITILSGQTTGSVTFTVKDDLLIEGNETATLTISNPSAGISLGTTTTQNIAITDDDNASTSSYGLPVAGAYRLVLSGGTLEIYNSGNSLVASRPLGTAAVVINGTAGNDTLTVDFSGGNFTVPISFNGGAQTSAPGDSLALTGGTFATGTFGFTNNSDGTVLLTGNSLISYTGLEPILATGLTMNNVIFTFNGGPETITLTDAVGAAMTIDSTQGESVTFANPSSSLSINLTASVDTFALTSVDAAFGGALFINGTMIDGYNTAPVANSQEVTAIEDVEASVTLTGDDGDAFLTQAISYVLVSLPASGTLSETLGGAAITSADLPLTLADAVLFFKSAANHVS